MKRFLLKLGFFSLTCFVLLNVVAIFYDTTSRRRVEDPGGEIYDAIRRSHQPSTCPMIVIGDSVCHQLLTGYAPPGLLSLGTNQAASMCGQYLIARSAIDHDPAVKEIVLAYLPDSFTNNLDQKFTFNYFVRPFYPHAEYRALMSPLVMHQVDRRPTARLVVLPLFRYTTMLTDSYLNYCEGAETPNFTYLAPVSIEYLRKLSELCNQHAIKLGIVCPPISLDRNYDQTLFQKEVVDAHLEKVFAGYPQSVRLVDPQLLVDHIHFKEENIGANSAIFVKLLESEASP
jgi:hypothetical protein